MPLVSWFRSVLNWPSYIPLPNTVPSPVTVMMPLRVSTVWTKGLAAGDPFQNSVSSTVADKGGTPIAASSAIDIASAARDSFSRVGAGAVPINASVQVAPATTRVTATEVRPRYSIAMKPVTMDPAAEPRMLDRYNMAVRMPLLWSAAIDISAR